MRRRISRVGRRRPKATDGAVWQLSATDCYSSYAWAELVVCCNDNAAAKQASKLARPVARELKQAGWRLERVLLRQRQRIRSEPFRQTVGQLQARITHIRSRWPQTNGHVEALHRLILESAGVRPSPASSIPATPGSSASPSATLLTTTTTRVHQGRLTCGRIPADIVYGARKMESR